MKKKKHQRREASLSLISRFFSADFERASGLGHRSKFTNDGVSFIARVGRLITFVTITGASFASKKKRHMEKAAKKKKNEKKERTNRNKKEGRAK